MLDVLCVLPQLSMFYEVGKLHLGWILGREANNIYCIIFLCNLKGFLKSGILVLEISF